MTAPLEWSLPPLPHAVSLARQRIRRECTTLPPAVLDTALLVASELVTNAIRYGEGDVALRCWPRLDGLRIEVSDRDPHRPRPADPGLEAEGGRGLMVVAALAKTWGVLPTQPAGKTVWAEIDAKA